MKPVATRNAYGEAILACGQADTNVVTLDADLQGSVKHSAFAKAFPDRNYNIGISEKDMAGTAAGLALAGKRPFAASFAVFTTGEGYNTIRQSICYTHTNVKLVGTHAGILTGEDGATHQSLEDIGLMRCLPHMEVYSPADYFEAKEVTNYLAKSNEPAYLRLGRASVPVLHEEGYVFEAGKAHVLKDGNDIAIFSHGATVHHCLAAANKLQDFGVNVAVISNPSIKPFDEETLLTYAKKTGKIITVEDHMIDGGLGSIVAEILSEQCPTQLLRHGMKGFGESGTSADLYKKYKLDADGIFGVIHEWMTKQDI
jgi:transketolase